MSRVKNHRICIYGHQTSLRLENEILHLCVASLRSAERLPFGLSKVSAPPETPNAH